MALYIPPTLRRRTRMLAGDDKFDYKQDFLNFLKDPELQKSRQQEKNDRSLLIGGGSEPRETLFLDGVQFLNNSLIPEILYPSLASNGPLEIITQFSDVIMTNCLFKDNYYPRSGEISVREKSICFEKFQSQRIQLTISCFTRIYQIVWGFWCKDSVELHAQHFEHVLRQ